MLEFFQPTLHQRISSAQHLMIWIRSGHGMIEVDFQTYSDFHNRLIFLEPHQYIKFTFGEFEVGTLEFPSHFVANSPDFRVLFKHLISLGYIEFSERPQQLLAWLLNNQPQQILDSSAQQWFWQNPFEVAPSDYPIIFDIKEVIDQHFQENLSVEQLLAHVTHRDSTITRLFKHHLGVSVKQLRQKKLILESKKEMAFTDKPVQEVAFEMGFKDPAYFNRFFKHHTQSTPLVFRDQVGEAGDRFLEDLQHLIKTHHKVQHTSSFYAAQTHMTVKALSRKVKNKLNLTLGQLIRLEIMNSAKVLLTDLPVKEVAYELGFQEPQHFSVFFKKIQGESPSQYRSKKYNS